MKEKWLHRREDTKRRAYHLEKRALRTYDEGLLFLLAINSVNETPSFRAEAEAKVNTFIGNNTSASSELLLLLYQMQVADYHGFLGRHGDANKMR